MKTASLVILVSMSLLFPVFGFAKPLSELKISFHSQSKDEVFSKSPSASRPRPVKLTEEVSIIDTSLMWSANSSLDTSDRAIYDSYSAKADVYLEVQPVELESL